MTEGFYVVDERTPWHQREAIVVYMCFRDILPDNDTFSLYYDLIAKRFETERHLTKEEMAKISVQSVKRFQISLNYLLDMKFVTVTEIKVPGRTRPARKISLLDVDIRPAATILAPPAPATLPLMDLPAVAPPPAMVKSKGKPKAKSNGKREYVEGWGNQPQFAVHALIDEVHGWNATTISPEIYKREIRDVTSIAMQYSPEHVRAKLVEIVIREPRWRNERISAGYLLRKLPEQSRRDQYGSSTLNGHKDSTSTRYETLEDFTGRTQGS